MAERQHLIAYDGTCPLCCRAVAFVRSQDSCEAFEFVPFESDSAEALLTGLPPDATACDSMLVWPGTTSDQAVPLSKSAAVLFICSRMGWPWRALALFRHLPSYMLDWAYEQVAKNRQALGGSRGTCRVRQS